jgi:hypothetical protein
VSCYHCPRQYLMRKKYKGVASLLKAMQRRSGLLSNWTGQLDLMVSVLNTCHFVRPWFDVRRKSRLSSRNTWASCLCRVYIGPIEIKMKSDERNAFSTRTLHESQIKR